MGGPETAPGSRTRKPGEGGPCPGGTGQAVSAPRQHQPTASSDGLLAVAADVPR